MSNDFTNSNIQRLNVLNNRFAIEKIESELSLGGIKFQNISYFTKQQVARLLDVEERTIDRYLSSHGEELTKNGYLVIRGALLRDFIGLMEVDDINVVDLRSLKTTPQLGIFSFKSVLNLAMLLTESERAKQIRARILDIVIAVIATKAGGHSKYINQRAEEYLPAAFQEENYRKKFTSALSKYVENFPFKYPQFTDRIYQSIFSEKAVEYRKILKLHSSENVRDTMYAEVLELISAYENGLAAEIEKKAQSLGKKLNYQELKQLFEQFEASPLLEPLKISARTKMASRDLSFRDALHAKLKAYIGPVSENDYERFLGEKSKALQERIDESLDVYKRLRDR